MKKHSLKNYYLKELLIFKVFFIETDYDFMWKLDNLIR